MEFDATFAVVDDGDVGEAVGVKVGGDEWAGVVVDDDHAGWIEAEVACEAGSGLGGGDDREGAAGDGCESASGWKADMCVARGRVSCLMCETEHCDGPLRGLWGRI